MDFFNEHGLARDEIDHFAANLLGSPVSATLVQGATSYTISGDEAAQVVRQLYGDFVPEYKSQGMFGLIYVYVANLAPGLAFCRQRLQQTVQDFAKFFASAWINKPAYMLEPPPGLLGEYSKILDELPRLFRSCYLMATGYITGIVDWADAKIAPFGVSLANMEKTFYRVTGYISKDDRRSIEVARLFGFFREHSREEKEHAIAYLSALYLL
ncbi:hypothetical protein BKA64DRAFT_695675 [Cadophora sp. MPI-SDFR-AT-0126]|nr:hypothetical protein BKA64DRAFT_695675 [Leotiomycetes sp. MPI-SDFR-AT-0126]